MSKQTTKQLGFFGSLIWALLFVMGLYGIKMVWDLAFIFPERARVFNRLTDQHVTTWQAYCMDLTLIEGLK